MMTDFEVLFCGRDFYVVDKGEDYMESFKVIGYDKSNGEDHSAVCLLNSQGEIESFTSQLVKIDCGPITPKQIDWGNKAYKTAIPNEYKRDQSPNWTKESQLREFEKVCGIYKRAEPAKPALPPIPAGATRHKALPQACLTLPDAAAFMKGM